MAAAVPPLRFWAAAIAGSTNMSSLVVMSKGTKFTQQSYKVSGGQAGRQAGRQVVHRGDCSLNGGWEGSRPASQPAS